MTIPAPLFWLLHALALRPADTQTTPAERACLARHAVGRKKLVEIGVMHGASTRLLCDAMASDGRLVAVDPFSPGRLGVSFEWAVAHREVARAAARRVMWRRERSESAVMAWTEPIDFLFIDGDHSWRGISHDWTEWTRFVEPGGVVALHDSRAIDGHPVADSVRYTRDVVLADERFACIDCVDSLTVLRRGSAHSSKAVPDA